MGLSLGDASLVKEVKLSMTEKQKPADNTQVTDTPDQTSTQKAYPTTKRCEIMQYWDYMDTKDINEVIARIKSLRHLNRWSIITHDKDTREDGSKKSPHFHAVITFTNTITFKTIADTLHVPVQYVNKIKVTTLAAEMYHIHRNDPGKYQYDPKEVHASFDYSRLVDDTPAKISRAEIAEMIANGTIKRYNLVNNVSADEYARNQRYYENCFDYRQKSMKGLDRQMECIFITGQSGTGKTTYAKEYATAKGYHTYISSGGKNPLDNYGGEECIILDDTRSSTWSLTDFLKLTDNHTDSLVGCRYYNKSIAECKLLIVTSCKSLDEFYENALNNDHEPKVQLLRRFKLLITMTHDKILISVYNPAKQTHQPHIELINSISLRYDPQMAYDFANDFAETLGLKVHSADLPLITDEDDQLPLEWR